MNITSVATAPAPAINDITNGSRSIKRTSRIQWIINGSTLPLPPLPAPTARNCHSQIVNGQRPLAQIGTVAVPIKPIRWVMRNSRQLQNRGHQNPETDKSTPDTIQAAHTKWITRSRSAINEFILTSRERPGFLFPMERADSENHT